MLTQLSKMMPKISSNLAQMQEQVSKLSTRMDQLSASRSISIATRVEPGGGGEGPGRPVSELRGIARGDVVAGLTLQPGHDRKPISPWEVTENVQEVTLGVVN